MSTLDKAGMALKVVCSLIFSIGMLAVLPGIAAAQPFSGFITFCDPTVYDNTTPQPTAPGAGLFTDIHRGKGINADADNCVLNITGSAGSSGDMWITLLGTPGNPTPPTFSCVEIEADVVIHRFDNRKAVGFVTNYDTATNTGLFIGLYDNGNTDAITVSTFDGTTGQLKTQVATKALGSKIKENVLYELEVDVCTGVDFLEVTAAVELSSGSPNEGGCDENPDTVCLLFDGDLPAGLSVSGQIGIAGQSKNAFVDSGVVDFEWTDFDF